MSPAVSVLTGWSAFQQGDFDRAEAHFLAALAVDSTLAEAYTGLGWSRAFAGDIDNAERSFRSAIVLAPNDASAAGGYAAVELAIAIFASNEFTASTFRRDVITYARMALELDPAWTFAYRAGIDYQDLRLILTQALALENRHGEAQVELDILDPDNGLDPDDPASWVVANVTYASYSEALFAAIEEVEHSIGTALP